MSPGSDAVADVNGRLLSQSDPFVVVVSCLGKTGGTIWQLFDIPAHNPGVRQLLQTVTKEYETDSGMETLTINFQFNESGNGSYRVNVTGEKVPTYQKYSPAFALKQCFDDKMKSENGHTLFQDFSIHIKHLPFRQSKNGVWQKLCHSSYYAREDDLNLMVSRLEVGNGDLARPTVYYAVAPAGSGKIASVAAAFVQSAKGNRMESYTHYLYIAFSNNKDRNFQAHGAVSDDATQA
ncbi:hypothetical protein SEMRO_109_G054370.1 [Seminavis robusta]|uniref:Uncharacterized protein n=1 Tax=Seminavis robusta TaxID=568900 RepID=A0A9N8DDU5_9STRA|nr:hypothetical protein SEMRO_109_G054370.1 [Seminavis robusta]|eukprot:Sro109_g054370.1 n/a (236) ;mRNA; f:150-857